MRFKKSKYRKRKGRKFKGSRYKKAMRKIAKAAVNRGKETYRVDRFWDTSLDGEQLVVPDVINPVTQASTWVIPDACSLGTGSDFVQIVYLATDIGDVANPNNHLNIAAAPIIPSGNDIIRRNIIIRGETYINGFYNPGAGQYVPLNLTQLQAGAPPNQSSNTFFGNPQGMGALPARFVRSGLFVIERANKDVNDVAVLAYLVSGSWQNTPLEAFQNPTVIKIIKQKIFTMDPYHCPHKKFKIKLGHKYARRQLRFISNQVGGQAQDTLANDNIFIVWKTEQYWDTGLTNTFPPTAYWRNDALVNIRILYKDI